MRTSKFNNFWRGKEVKTEPSKIQKSDFKTLWKGGEAALAKGAMDELKNYIQLRLDQNIPHDKALDQAIAVNGRLPEMKRLDPSEVETLVEQVYNKTEKATLQEVNSNKLYTAQQIQSKYAGKFVDVYPHHHDYFNNGKFETVYEVRGVSSKIKENYEEAEEIGKSR